MTDTPDYAPPGAGCDLAAVRELTSALLSAAENCDWSEVQRLDDVRTQLLRGLPATAFASGDPELRATLSAALEATGLIERQLADARDEIGRQLKQHNQRQVAVDAYRSAG